MSSKSIWWHLPKLRTDADEHKHRAATPLDLFYDLIFVAIIAVLAHELVYHMEKHPGWHTFGEFFLLFIPVWWVWIGNTYYNERFGTNDVSQRLFTFLQMIPAAGLAYFAHNGLDPKATVGFALCYAFARAIIVVLWCRGAWYNRVAVPYVRGLAIGFTISIILFVVSAFVDPSIRYTLWVIALIIDLVTPMLILKANEQMPKLSEDHLKERFNLLTIIILGETVAGVVGGASKSHSLSLLTATAGILALLIACGFWFLYFDQVMKGVSKKGHWPRLLWNYGHLPLVMGWTIFGAGTLAIVGHADAHVEDPVRWLIAGGSGMGILSLLLIELSQKGYVDGMESVKDFRIIRLVSGLACFGLGFFGHGLNAAWLLGIVFLLVIIQAVYGLYKWVSEVKKKDDPSNHGWTI
ncbi:MAG: low temperature requirement protein A [Bacteroidota bacterium]